MVVPELWGIPVAVLALVVAGAGFLISLFALGWQIVKHFFDGGRVRVYLNLATWHPEFSLLVQRSGHWKVKRSESHHVGPENFELAQLVVENPGRTAVTIYSPGLAIKGKRIGRFRLRRTGHSVVPRMFELKDFGPDNATKETTVRIEPYDRVTFLLDFWSVVPSLRETANGKTIKMRGQVSVAGALWPKKSVWRRRWRIRPTDWTGYSNVATVSPRTVIWRAFYVGAAIPSLTDDASDQQLRQGLMGYLVSQAMKKFDEQPERQAFEDEIERVAREDFSMKYPIFGMAAWNAWEALERNAAHLSAWTWPLPKKKPVAVELEPPTAEPSA